LGFALAKLGREITVDHSREGERAKLWEAQTSAVSAAAKIDPLALRGKP
jgi:hypothetical protein